MKGTIFIYTYYGTQLEENISKYPIKSFLNELDCG
jgi:hypothetical protein